MLDSNLEEEEMILKMPIFLLPPDPEPEEGEEDGKEDQNKLMLHTIYTFRLTDRLRVGLTGCWTLAKNMTFM